MFLEHHKIKRQIGIVSDVLEAKTIYSMMDFSVKYNVDEVTIKRDLNDLRSQGIAIHSKKNRGVYFQSKLTDAQLSYLFLQYISIIQTNCFIQKSASNLISIYKNDALINLTKLQKAIDCSLTTLLIYGNNSEKIEVFPLQLFEMDNGWRLLTQTGNKTKQFRLDKIKSVEITDKKFTPIKKENVQELFNHSWKCWIGDDLIKVKLLLDTKQQEWVESKILIANQKKTYNEDGTMVLEVVVNSLTEITSWIVSRGQGCKVLEPVELKEEVLRIAKETLSNYV